MDDEKHGKQVIEKIGKINNAIIFSDVHASCQLAVCPPVEIELGEDGKYLPIGGVKLDSGGTYMPSDVQMKIWPCWDEFWGVWVPMVTKGEPWVAVLNGDGLDGTHHNSVTQITHNLADQQKIAEMILKPVLTAPHCEGYYHIRGTEAHAGKSGQYEELLARSLNATPNSHGQYARDELWLRVGKSLVNCMHQIGTTGVAAYETTAVHRELIAMYTEAAQWGDEPPDISVRSHRHRYSETRIPTNKGYGIGVVTPGWQLKTPFVFRTGMKHSTPQLGGILVRQGDEEAFCRSRIWPLGRPKTEGEI